LAPLRLHSRLRDHRAMARARRSQGATWWANEGTRVLFERQTRQFFPDLQRFVSSERCTYTLTVIVPEYDDARRIKLMFDATRSRSAPHILSDGPTESPHRYADNERMTLCVWEPTDPPEQRWLWDDGLLVLLALIRLHLFKESWWRDTGEWPGPQARRPALTPRSRHPRHCGAGSRSRTHAASQR
jgi:hypothetical protein